MAATLLVGAACAAAVAAEHVVQQGDTLVQIARNRMGDGARWRELAEANKLAPPYALHVGQRLVLPAGWPATAPAGGATRPAGGQPAALPPVQAFRTTGRAMPSPAAGAAPATRTGSASGPAAWGGPHVLAFLATLSAVAIGLVCVGVLLWWVFFALCLRGACWFSMVQATLGACFRLALYLVLLGAACTALGMMLPVLGDTRVSPPAMLALGALAVLAYFVSSLVVTRQVLACQWRSVVTVLVMATFVSDLLAAAVGVTVIVLMGAAVG
jgi:hypothetical protein